MRPFYMLFAASLLAAACGPSGTGPSERISPAIQAAERGPCSPVSDHAGHQLVWCPAYGPTCASSGACDYIDPGGESRGPADPPAPAQTSSTRLTLFLRGNCSGLADLVTVQVAGASVREESVLTPGGPGFSMEIAPGEYTIEARSESGLNWEPFLRSVPTRGMVQRLTCR
jgi:hypothetical protein